jgi:hypothetical protein
VCCRNFQGADCSERTCPFGNAHVDSPKGDLDGSADALSGTSTTIAGSTIYPFGTQEQYPDSQTNEGHFYMECSNKGMCDRSSGLCECYDGYEGSACQRAGCPNDCSGHGTCETIKELAEDKGAGEGVDGLLDLSGVPALRYELWDKTITMGCKCDGGFYGPDCSLKRCPYGVDPLFIPSNYDFSGTYVMSAALDRTIMGDDGVPLFAPSYEISIIDIDISGADTLGTFDLIFYDVFGEEYRIDGVAWGHYRARDTPIVNAPSGANGNGYYTHATNKNRHEKRFWYSNHAEVPGEHNITTCEDIMTHFPNERLKDTRLGGTHHSSNPYGVSHKGGLVSTAYAGSPSMNHANHTPSSYYKMSVAPFCTLMNHTSLNQLSIDNHVDAPTYYDYGSRFVFDYNRGNPGYHRDMRVENAKVIDSLPERSARITYWTKRQGEVAEYVSSDDVPGTVKTSHTSADAALFGVTLPGYITEYVAYPIQTHSVSNYEDESKGRIRMSTLVDQYIGGVTTAPVVRADWKDLSNTPYKTSWIAFTPVGQTQDSYFNVTAIRSVDKLIANEGNVELYTKVSELDINLAGTAFCPNVVCDVNSWPAVAENLVSAARTKVKAKLKQKYQYVSECANRGICDTESGLCSCFSGYTHDNCDTQTPVC